MPLCLSKDLERVRRDLLTMSALVEQAIGKAMCAVIMRRGELGHEVIRDELEIDAREVAIEEDCLRILALHQPVACDLRFLVATLKVNASLERMGDLAVNIAERALVLGSRAAIEAGDFRAMAGTVLGMVNGALNAFVSLDSALAVEVRRSDSGVDAAHRLVFGAVQEIIRARPDCVELALHTLSVSRHLERVADLATNIAEDVVFMVNGEVLRHRHEQLAVALPEPVGLLGER
jgi:phosphate transport system protein